MEFRNKPILNFPEVVNQVIFYRLVMKRAYLEILQFGLILISSKMSLYCLTFKYAHLKYSEIFKGAYFEIQTIKSDF